LDTSAIEILAANRDHAGVVYCPRTHAHFGHSTYPLLELRRRGIPVVLGTDSRASNPDLSIFEEARKVRRDFHELSSAEILAMITTRPADLLGRAADWGYVIPGGLARLTAIPCQAKKPNCVLDDLLESSDPTRPLEAVVGALK
jgi:cytosine/adenosine deaminase-related metal-dependent hydrolase